MTSWFAHQAFDSLWALVWHFGIIAGIMILALAHAYFIPINRKAALVVALLAGVMLLTASVYTKLGANYVQAKWDAATKADYDAAVSARATAEAAIPPVRPGPAPKLRHDRYNRDQQSGNGGGFPPYHILRFKGYSADHKANPGP